MYVTIGIGEKGRTFARRTGRACKTDKDGARVLLRDEENEGGRERYLVRGGRNDRGMEGGSRKSVCVLFEEECILYKG